MVSMINCNEFYESQKKNFQTLLNRISNPKDSATTLPFNFQPEQRQIFGLYTTFVFQKLS